MTIKSKLLRHTAIAALCSVTVYGLAAHGYANAGETAPRHGYGAPEIVPSTTGTTEARVDIDIDFFFDELEPYGRWVRHDRYNYVFVPINIESDWAPYREGHWVYTRRYGWMWVSDEPFGWATYHYGRWAYDREIGWYWVPGTRWAPAWVSWRRGHDHVGWAPLPPEGDGFSISIQIGTYDVPEAHWIFVPTHSFLDRNLDRVVIRGGDRHRFYELSEPLGPVVVENNVVVNNVININYIEEQTNEKVVVREVRESDSVDSADREDGETVQVFAPEVAEPTGDAKPEKVVEVEEVKKERRKKRDQADVKDSETGSDMAADDGKPKAEQTGEQADQSETDADAKAGTTAEATGDVKRKDKAKAETDADAKAASTAESDGDAKRKPKAKAEVKTDADAKAGTSAQADDVKRKPKANASADSEANVKANAKAKQAPEPASNAAVTDKKQKKPAKADAAEANKAKQPGAEPAAERQQAEKPGKRKPEQAARKGKKAAEECTEEARAAQQC